MCGGSGSGSTAFSGFEEDATACVDDDDDEDEASAIVEEVVGAE